MTNQDVKPEDVNPEDVKTIDGQVDPVGKAKESPGTGGRYYVRFSVAQRYLHGVLAVTFLGCALTGLPLRFSNSRAALALAHAVGGFGTILFFHLLNAVVMTVAFLTHVGDVAYRVVVRKEYGLVWGPNSMVPRLKDLQDFIGNMKWFLFLGPKPKMDRYAYWEKFDYWGVFWGMAIIGFSGYAMWFASFFARFIPGSWLNIALLIHGEEALLAVGFIFTVHFFNTHLRPGDFPMDLVIFNGRLTEKELLHKHPEEYKRLQETGELEKFRAEAPPRWIRNFGWVFGYFIIVSGFLLIALTAVAFVKE
jgi:cytochrome b subunit of formate dehydrogenase